LKSIERTAVHRNPVRFDDGSHVHFVTTNTDAKRPYFEDERCCRILLQELRFYSRKLGFRVLGYAIMPDHVHLLLWWDANDNPTLTISKVMQAVKGATARRIIDSSRGRSEHPLRPVAQRRERMLPATQQGRGAKSHKQNLKYRVWQPGFYDFNVYSERMLLEKLDYVHGNPVRAGMVASPGDYPWSSYRFYVSEEPTLDELHATAGRHVTGL